MLKTLPCSLFVFLWVGIGFPAFSQPSHPRSQLQTLAKQEGEIFIVVEYPHAEQQKNCRLEDLFTNTIAFSKDTLLVDFNNYTESFCEVTKLETRLLYQVRLSDLDPAKLILMQRVYNLKDKKLLEGSATWYEVQLNTREAKPLVTEKSVIENQTRRISQFRLLFKTQEGAKRAQAALRELARPNG